jgi:hypothetical protein
MTSATDTLGRVRNLNFDTLNRETGETWVVSGSMVNTLTYTYDAANNQLTAADGNGADTSLLTEVDEQAGRTIQISHDNLAKADRSLGPTGSSWAAWRSSAAPRSGPRR